MSKTIHEALEGFIPKKYNVFHQQHADVTPSVTITESDVTYESALGQFRVYHKSKIHLYVLDKYTDDVYGEVADWLDTLFDRIYSNLGVENGQINILNISTPLINTVSGQLNEVIHSVYFSIQYNKISN